MAKSDTERMTTAAGCPVADNQTPPLPPARAGNDDYTRAGDLFRLISKDKQKELIDSLVAAITGVPEHIQLRQIGHFHKADPAYGEGVAGGLKLDLKKAIKAA